MARPWLVVDGYVQDPEGGAGNFLPHLTERAVQTARPAWGEPLGLPTDYDAIVMTGSAAGVNDGLDWVDELIDFVRGALDAQVPVLGVCFGHQVLATAALGPGTVRQAPRPEVGWYAIESASDPLLGSFPQRFTTFLSHGDEVDPARAGGLRVFARSERCAVQAYQVPGRRAWGVQFHAEMALPEASKLVRRRVGVDLPGDPEETIAGAVDSSALIAALMRNFAALAG